MSVVFILYLLFSSCANDEYVKSIEKHRQEINYKFRLPEESPLKEEDRIKFQGLNYFLPDESWLISANFTKLENEQPFIMITSGAKRPEYIRYGKLEFEISGEKYNLTVYRNTAHENSGKYQDHLFIPFTDLTNGEESYGGGRYMELKLPLTELVNIDFNKAYNPYCAYNDKYSCPVPPRENFLNIRIEAGEKVFYEK